MELTCFGQFRAVPDSLGQFWTVKDDLTVRPKPSFGRPKPNPVCSYRLLDTCYTDQIMISCMPIGTKNI